MDNASKAILMAGGVLIAIALISVAVYAFNSSQIQSFNRFYQEYRTSSGTSVSIIKCIDAVNILNRAVDDGIERELSSDIISVSSGNVYSADPKNYTTKQVSYSLSYDPVGRVSKVTIK